MILDDKELQPRGILWLGILVVLGALIIALIYFGKNIPGPEAGQNSNIGVSTGHRKPRSYSVFYKAGVFSPTNLRIRIGDTVKFENSGLIAIRIISDNNENGYIILPGLDSINEILPAESFSYTFSTSGIFGYYNYNKELERGVVIVKEY